MRTFVLPCLHGGRLPGLFLLLLASLSAWGQPVLHGGPDCLADPGHHTLRQSLLARGMALPGPTAAGTPLVQVVYLVPADRAENPFYAHSLDGSIRHLQQWYSEHMPGGETFTLADPAVLTLHSTHPEAWYREHNNTNPFTTFYNNAIDDALALMGEPPGINPERIWLIYPDANADCGQCGGCGAGFPTGGGFAVINGNDLRGYLGGPEVRVCEGDIIANGYPPCRFVGGMGHELGHALGLPHPPGCDQGLPSCAYGSIMYTGLYDYPEAFLTTDEQNALRTHPFFTPQAFPSPLPDCNAFVPRDRAYLLEPHDRRFAGTDPWLVWGDLEPPAHTIEVATDVGFTHVVFTTSRSVEWIQFTDPGLSTTYFWRVRRYPDGAWSPPRRFYTDPTVSVEASAAPLAFHVGPLRPNPARSPVAVTVALATPGPVRLTVFDLLGRQLGPSNTYPFPAGTHVISIPTAFLPAGTYVVQLDSHGARHSQRLVLLP